MLLTDDANMSCEKSIPSVLRPKLRRMDKITSIRYKFKQIRSFCCGEGLLLYNMVVLHNQRNVLLKKTRNLSNLKR